MVSDRGLGPKDRGPGAAGGHSFMMRGAPERLQDILDSIDSIEKYVSRGFDAYSEDELIQVRIMHHIK